MVAMKSFVIGSRPKLSVDFRDRENNDALYDPSEVVLQVLPPDGVLRTYEYGVDLDVIKDADGQYHYYVNADQAGTWHWYWRSGEGDGQAADAGFFEIEDSPAFAGPS